MLTSEQIEKRRKGIGGSDARTIMFGGPEDWQELYDQKVHGKKLEFPLDRQLLIDLGHVAEPLCLAMYDKKVAPLEQLQPEHMIYWKVDPFFFFTPDGIRAGDGQAVQCKFHSGDRSIIDLAEYYAPQVLHEMMCLGQSKGHLAVIFGHYGRFMHIEVERDDAVLERYIMRAMEFKQYLITGELPETMAAAVEKIAVPRQRDHVWDTGDNMVATLCMDIIENVAASVKFDEALGGLKKICPTDARSAKWVGHDGRGVMMKIAKNGSKRWYPITPQSAAFSEAAE